MRVVSPSKCQMSATRLLPQCSTWSHLCISTATRMIDLDRMTPTPTTRHHTLKKLILIYLNFHAKCTHSNDDDDDDGTQLNRRHFDLACVPHSTILVTRHPQQEHMSGYHGVKRHNMNIVVYEVNTNVRLYVFLNHMSSFIPMFELLSRSLSLFTYLSLSPSFPFAPICESNETEAKAPEKEIKATQKTNAKMWRKFSLIFSATIEKRLLFTQAATARPFVCVASRHRNSILSFFRFYFYAVCDKNKTKWNPYIDIQEIGRGHKAHD